MAAEQRRVGRDLLVGTAAVVLGQLLLLAIAPLSRAASDGVERSGIALLSPDSLTYLELAADPAWLVDTPWNRLLLVAILRLGSLLGDAATFLVVLQACALAIASALVHRMTVRLGGPIAGLLATVVIAVNPLTAQWVRFVLSETLFFALVLITLFAGERVLRGAAQPPSVLLLLVAAALATCLRPNGVLVLGSALTLLVLTRTAPRGRAALLSGLIWLGVLAGLVLGLTAAGQPTERSLTAQIHRGIVIEGTDDVIVAIAMPAADEPADTSLAAGLRYVAAEPLAAARLAAARIVAEAIQVRPHYPVLINISIGAAMAVFALAVIIGLRTRAASALIRSTVIIGSPILLLVGATFATPEGRYGWAALVLGAPLAGLGVARTLRAARIRWFEGQLLDGPGTAR